MTPAQYSSRALKHWEKWLPKKVASLRAAGNLETELQVLGRKAFDRQQELMGQGFRDYEAQEVVLAELVLLKPEADAAVEPQERAELKKLEQEHRQLRG